MDSPEESSTLKLSDGKHRATVYSKCCAYCRATRASHPNRSFFAFPIDPAMSHSWVAACNLPFLRKKTTQQLHTTYRICSEHFSVHDYASQKMRYLTATACPKFPSAAGLHLKKLKLDMKKKLSICLAKASPLEQNDTAVMQTKDSNLCSLTEKGSPTERIKVEKYTAQGSGKKVLAEGIYPAIGASSLCHCELPKKTSNNTKHIEESFSECVIKKGKSPVRSRLSLLEQLILARRQINILKCYAKSYEEEHRELHMEQGNSVVRNMHTIKQDAIDGDSFAIILLNQIATYSPTQIT